MSDLEPYPFIPLYATEEQIARAVLGKGPKNFTLWKMFAAHLQKSGLPMPDPITKRRYWPAVRAFLDRRNGLHQQGFPGVVDGSENFAEDRMRRRPARKPPTMRS